MNDTKTVDDVVQTYDLTTRILDGTNAQSTMDSETIYRDLTADMLAGKLSEHGFTLQQDVVTKGRITVAGGLQLIWEPVAQQKPTTPLESLQMCVTFLKRANLSVTSAGVNNFRWCNHELGFEAHVDYGTTLSQLLDATTTLRDQELTVVVWDWKHPSFKRRAMQIHVRGKLAGVPMQLGFSQTSDAIEDYLINNVPGLAEVEDHTYLPVPLDVMQAAAKAGEN